MIQLPSSDPVTWGQLVQQWGDLVGAMIQTVALVVGASFTLYRIRQAVRARMTDFHVVVRHVETPTRSDDPIDGKGFWAVFSNGTGAPVSEWSIVVSAEKSERLYELSSDTYLGPIPPTQSRLMAAQIPVENAMEDEKLVVVKWEFKSGGRRWCATRDGNVTEKRAH